MKSKKYWWILLVLPILEYFLQYWNDNSEKSLATSSNFLLTESQIKSVHHDDYSYDAKKQNCNHFSEKNPFSLDFTIKKFGSLISSRVPQNGTKSMCKASSSWDFSSLRHLSHKPYFLKKKKHLVFWTQKTPKTNISDQKLI